MSTNREEPGQGVGGQASAGSSARSRPAAATIIALLALLGALGSALMTVAHLDLEIPVVSALGPEGRSLPGVAAGFAVGVLLFALVTYAAWTVRPWTWPLALVVNALAFASAVMPWRGLESSGPPALVTAVALIVLLSPQGRSALLYRDEPTRE